MHIPTILTILSLPLFSLAARPKKDAILLSKVETLTLRGRGAKTTSRRVSPVPQLKCISSSSLCNLHEIDVMRCTNQGSSYGDEDVEWSCSASLPKELKLGSTEVICEGYSSSEDPYVLKGSCGVEYRLALTDEGETNYPEIANGGWFSGGGGNGGSKLGTWLFVFIFVAVLGWILYSIRERAAGRDPIGGAGGRRPGGGGGGGGGGGWNPGWGPDDNDPPPPYPGSKPSSGQAQRGWQPGFWSGLAGGAAAGYMAGGRNNNRGDNNSHLGSGSSSGSSSSVGRARHQSTGFGSTSRR